MGSTKHKLIAAARDQYVLLKWKRKLHVRAVVQHNVKSNKTNNRCNRTRVSGQLCKKKKIITIKNPLITIYTKDTLRRVYGLLYYEHEY